MALDQIVLSDTGPLPLTRTFNALGDCDVSIFVSATAWSQTANATIAVDVSLDGELIGSLMLFANAASSHMALPAKFIPLRMTGGTHEISLKTRTPNTITDQNDYFQVVIDY